MSAVRVIYRRLCHASGSKNGDGFERAYAQSVEKPELFWGRHAENITWFKRYTKVLDFSKAPLAKWFVNGEMNTCYECVDRHVDGGRGRQVALVHDSPVTDSVTRITYSELHTQVRLFAGVLVRNGVTKGDRVIVYMPMIPEAIVCMLACARIGAIHSLVFGGFAANELASRINHAKAKVVVTSNVGIEPTRLVDYKAIVNAAFDISAHKPSACVVYQRPGYAPCDMVNHRDVEWGEEMAAVRGHDCVPVASSHPLYIIYTSGTTGQPKGIVRPSAGHAVVLKWSMNAIYGVDEGETWWAGSDLGWVVGHSYICYAPLLNGCTSVLFEGKPVGTPDTTTYPRILSQHNVVSFFTSPTAMRAIRKEDLGGISIKKYNLDKLRNIFVAGEKLDSETLEWTRNSFKVPVFDHWWQTETGFPISCTCVGLRNSQEQPNDVSGMPVPGWDLKVVDKNGNGAALNELGQIVAKVPLPPSFLSSLWGDTDDKVQIETYFTKYPGYYDTMDSGMWSTGGYIGIWSRTDDVMNVAGHRLSSGALEEAIMQHGDVLECAVVGLKDPLKGVVPFGFIVTKWKCDFNVVFPELIGLVREQIGPVAVFKHGLFVAQLPKTRSGKVARNTLHAMVNEEPVKIPATIEDSSVYDNIREQLEKMGYHHS